MPLINNQPSELQIQAKVFQYITNKYYETRYCLYHIKNETDTEINIADFIKLKNQIDSGLTPGIQDFHFLWRGVTYRIELKDYKGRCSAAQKVVHAAHARNGALTWLFNSSDSCIAFLEYIITNAHSAWHSIPIFQDQLRFVFKDAISPYCVPENLEQYINEYEADKLKRRERRKKKACF